MRDTKPRYSRGDYVKVASTNSTTDIEEWMWVRVTGRDMNKQLIFGVLDSEPLSEYTGKINLGSELALSFSQVREHRKPTEFMRPQ